jgi:hypothetical protein
MACWKRESFHASKSLLPSLERFRVNQEQKCTFLSEKWRFANKNFCSEMAKICRLTIHSAKWRWTHNSQLQKCKCKTMPNVSQLHCCPQIASQWQTDSNHNNSHQTRNQQIHQHTPLLRPRLLFGKSPTCLEKLLIMPPSHLFFPLVSPFYKP